MLEAGATPVLWQRCLNAELQTDPASLIFVEPE